MNVLTNVNLNKNELQNAVMQNLATAPANPREGQIYYNSADKLLYIYKGSVKGWEAAGGIAEDEIVYLEYGVSTFEEAKAAFDAGKTLITKYDGSDGAPGNYRAYYPCYLVSDSEFTFVVSTDEATSYAILSESDGWSSEIFPIFIGANDVEYDSEDEYDNDTVGKALQDAETDIDNIQAVIPSTASSSDQLVTASQMGDAISAVEAKQIYKTSTQGSFATKAELTAATVFYNADGTQATPTKNDVAYVLADESHEGKAAKYVIASIDEDDDSITWGFVITFSNTAFTQQQMNAINSGITAELVGQIGKLKTASGTLTAGQTTASVTASGTIVNVKIKDATTGDEVITDVRETSSGVTVTIAQAHSNDLGITVLYKET